MRRPRLVLIGNGMAGVRTLEELLKLAPDLFDITVFGAEPHPNYNRIQLSPVLSGESRVEEIILNDRDWYERHGIRLHLGKRVVGINRRDRRVIAQDNISEPYDRLLLATGSNPVILPIPVRLSIGVAWLVIVAAEMLTGGVGIGFWVWDEWNNLKVEHIIIAIITIGVVGLVLEQALVLLARRFSYGS